MLLPNVNCEIINTEENLTYIFSRKWLVVLPSPSPPPPSSCVCYVGSGKAMCGIGGGKGGAFAGAFGDICATCGTWEARSTSPLATRPSYSPISSVIGGAPGNMYLIAASNERRPPWGRAMMNPPPRVSGTGSLLEDELRGWK